MTWPTPHLTAVDLDAFHSASLSREASLHLESCAECRELVERDRALVHALESLPGFDPADGFAGRVLAGIARPVPAVVPIRRRTRLALAASVMIGLGASIGWSALNWATLRGWADSAPGEVSRLVWDGVTRVAQSIAQQPLVAGLGNLGFSTGLLALFAALLLVGYVGAMVALRRLLALPAMAQPALDAGR
ncbi:MAG: hypothetical protein ACT4PM_09910 [Gemmatimonadales bacterium]